MPKATAIAELFAYELNARLATGEKGVNYRGFAVIGGRTYDKVVDVETGYHSTEERAKGVHAFIDRATGDLIKAASWSAPQKNADKTLAVRYHLGSPEEAKEVAAKADRHGSYLYK